MSLMRTFICDCCGLAWEVEMTEAAQKAASDECKKNFGVDHHESDAVLCDQCYQQFLILVERMDKRN